MQIFQISVVSVGQWDGTVYTTVRTRARTSVIYLHSINPYQHLQQTNNTCSKLNYTVFSLSQEVNIELHPEGSPCSNCSSQTLNYLVYLHQTCHLDLTFLSQKDHVSVSQDLHSIATHQCNITNGLGQITCDSNQHFWVGYDILSHTLILHPHRPFDYCVTDAKVFLSWSLSANWQLQEEHSVA